MNREEPMNPKITDVRVRDIRFPTSLDMDGSDALNLGDYSATYVTLVTDTSLEGNGLTFTNGRGNEVCVAAVQALKHHVLGRTLELLTENFGGFWNEIASDSQVRWLGPEKGVIHLATAALVNAVWDLHAKDEGKPLWKLLVDMTPEQIVACVPFRHITDALTPAEALEILRRWRPTRAEREALIRELGYTDERVRRLLRQSLDDGWTHFKMKVGRDLSEDVRRAELIREEIGWERG